MALQPIYGENHQVVDYFDDGNAGQAAGELPPPPQPTIPQAGGQDVPPPQPQHEDMTPSLPPPMHQHEEEESPELQEEEESAEIQEQQEELESPELQEEQDQHEGQDEHEDSPSETDTGQPSAWMVPAILKRHTGDVFLGTTIHHDDGDPRGPLISVFVRDLPDGPVPIFVKTFRADELSKNSFLDTLQTALAAVMQQHLLGWADQERQKLAQQARQKTRPSSAATPTVSTVQTPKPVSTSPSTSSQTPPASAPAQAQMQKSPKSSTAATGTTPPKYAAVSMFDEA